MFEEKLTEWTSSTWTVQVDEFKWIRARTDSVELIRRFRISESETIRIVLEKRWRFVNYFSKIKATKHFQRVISRPGDRSTKDNL